MRVDPNTFGRVSPAYETHCEAHGLAPGLVMFLEASGKGAGAFIRPCLQPRASRAFVALHPPVLSRVEGQEGIFLSIYLLGLWYSASFLSSLVCALLVIVTRQS